MSLRLRSFSISLAALVLMAAMRLSAQAPVAAPPPPPPLPPGIAASLSNLADQPASHMGFVFDRSMLQMARGVLEANGMAPQRAAAALSSIAYDNYRYPQPAMYTPETMTSILNAYRAAGWKHLVDAHDSSQKNSYREGTATDLWLHFNGMDVDGVTVLTRGPHAMNVIQVACDLRPLELIHLSGHFGIPKVDPGVVMVPDPKDR